MPLVLLNQGEVDDAAGRCIGRTDVALAAAGRRAMETLATEWPYPAPKALISSNRKRAHAALTPFARRFGRLPAVDARLDEQDFGEWDGRFWNSLHGDHPEAMRAWVSDWVDHAPPGGESFRQVQQRAGEWLDEIIATHDDDALVLVGTHPGPIRAIVCHALAIELDHALLLNLAPGHVTALRRRRGRFELSYFNASRFEACLYRDDFP